MSLGENIYQLRTDRRMSQGDLADALGVSRQSISKWETDGSVPELDKLVKLAELFGVTLDELVTGKPPAAPEPSAPQVRPGLSGRQVAAAILLCMAFLTVFALTLLGGFLEGLIFSIPFWVCALICFCAKKHPGLWCAWAAVALIDLYLRWATGLSWTQILWTLQWEWSWNYTRLVIAWCQFLAGLGLAVVTVLTLRKTAKPLHKKPLFIAVAAFVLLGLPFPTWLFLALGERGSFLATLAWWLPDFLRLGLLSWFAAALLAWRKARG